MMKKKFTTLFFIGVAFVSRAQMNIGSNTAPNADAMLEISGSSKGLLLPRVTLSSTSSASPLSAHVAGMSVYNTATAGAGATAVTPGYYYNTGSAWVRVAAASGSGSSWLTGGNLNGAVSNIGTNDNYDLPFVTNNTEKMRISNIGNVGVGTNAPAAKVDVAAGTTTVNTVVNATGSINDYLQFNVQNTSTGTNAQSGYSSTADNGSATTGFAWMGINNSAFNYPTTYNIGGANDVSLLGSGQDLYVANANNTKSIIFSTGKATTPYFNERMRITNAGNVGIGTNAPSANLHVVNLGTTTNNIAQFLTPSLATTQATYLKLGKALSNGDQADIVYNWTGSNSSANYLGFSFYGKSIYMAITNGGLVGIGTAAPTALLHLDGGHIRSQQTTAPTIAVTTANGITAAAIAANSTDMKGAITTTGTNSGINTVLTITFNGTFNVAPTVIITPANANTQTCNFFVTSTTTTFAISFIGGTATPSFNYIVIE